MVHVTPLCGDANLLMCVRVCRVVAARAARVVLPPRPRPRPKQHPLRQQLAAAKQQQQQAGVEASGRKETTATMTQQTATASEGTSAPGDTSKCMSNHILEYGSVLAAAVDSIPSKLRFLPRGARRRFGGRRQLLVWRCSDGNDGHVDSFAVDRRAVRCVDSRAQRRTAS